MSVTKYWYTDLNRSSNGRNASSKKAITWHVLFALFLERVITVLCTTRSSVSPDPILGDESSGLEDRDRRRRSKGRVACVLLSNSVHFCQ